jgi:hypothetical protein
LPRRNAVGAILERFKRFVVICDNDATGLKYGEMWAVLEPSAVIVKSAEILPTLQEHGDITDIIEQIGAETAFKTLKAVVSRVEKEQIAEKKGKNQG